MPDKIKITDRRKLNPITKKPINPNRDKKDMKADPFMLKNLYFTAKDYGIDPNRFIAQALQESNLGTAKDAKGRDTDLNPFRINGAYHQLSEDPVAQAAGMIRDMDKKYKGKPEAYRIQAYNGLTPKTKANPAYGKSVVSLRDSVINQSPELQAYLKSLNSEYDNRYKAKPTQVKQAPNPSINPKLEGFNAALFALPIFPDGGKIQPDSLVLKPQKSNVILLGTGVDNTGKRRFNLHLSDGTQKDVPEKIFKQHKDLGYKVKEYNFGGQLGNILSTASPFLNLIPGIGQIASPLASMAGQALQGNKMTTGGQIRSVRGGQMINQGNGIEHAAGLPHELGGMDYNQGAEIQGGEKVLDGNYVITDQPGSNLDKTQTSISKRFGKDVSAISDRNQSKNIDSATEYLKQDAIMKNEKYLQARHEKMMSKLGKLVKEYGGSLETLTAQIGGYRNGGKMYADGTGISGLNKDSNYQDDGRMFQRDPNRQYNINPLDNFYNTQNQQLYPHDPNADYGYKGYNLPEQGKQYINPNSPYAKNNNQIPLSMDVNQTSTPNQSSQFDLRGTLNTLGTYAPSIYNLGKGLFDKASQLDSKRYEIPRLNANLVPENTGQNEIRDSYTRGLYDMKNSGVYSRLGQVNLTNQRAKQDYERRLQLAGTNAQIKNQVNSQNANIDAQNANSRMNVDNWNYQSKAAKDNYIGAGLSGISEGIQNDRNYKNDLAGMSQVFDNPGFQSYLQSIGYRKRATKTK